MGCVALMERVGKDLKLVKDAKVHYSVGVTGLFKGLELAEELVVDYGRDGTGLSYVEMSIRRQRGKSSVDAHSWPVRVLESEIPDDFKKFAAELEQTPAKLLNFLRHKAKAGHFKFAESN